MRIVSLTLFLLLLVPSMLLAYSLLAIGCRATGFDLTSVYCTSGPDLGPIEGAAMFLGPGLSVCLSWFAMWVHRSQFQRQHWILLLVISIWVIMVRFGGIANDDTGKRRDASHASATR